MYLPSFGIGTQHARKQDTWSKKWEGHKYHVNRPGVTRFPGNPFTGGCLQISFILGTHNIFWDAVNKHILIFVAFYRARIFKQDEKVFLEKIAFLHTLIFRTRG